MDRTFNRDAIDDRLKPYSWYKDFVMKGAQEHGLPLEYIRGYIAGLSC
jgi:hypothetical protein